MAKIKDTGQRRVYVLPVELVERIDAYQKKRGYSSEVEAVRKLIEVALNLSEDATSILVRLSRALKQVRDLHEAAKLVLVGHPHITDIGFHHDYLQYWVRDVGVFRLHESGQALKAGKDLTEWNEININGLLDNN